MIKKKKIPSNISLVDLCIDIYGKLDKLYDLQFRNNWVTNLYFDLSLYVGVEVSYDDELVDKNIIQLNYKSLEKKSSIVNSVGLNGQNIFDISLMTYGRIEDAYKLIKDSKIDGFNEVNMFSVPIVHDRLQITNEQRNNFNKKNKIIYSTGGVLSLPENDYGHSFDYSFDYSFDS
jgi:hypothetical protein